MLGRLKNVYSETMEQMQGEPLEFGGEDDHVHFLVAAHPKTAVSALAGKLKGKSSYILLRDFWEEINVKRNRLLFFFAVLSPFACQTPAPPASASAADGLDLPTQALRLVRVVGGGLAPSRTTITWDITNRQARYQVSSGLSDETISCQGTVVLEEEALRPLLQNLRVCKGQVDRIWSDGDRDTLTLVYPGQVTIPPAIDASEDEGTRRVVLQNTLNKAIEGPQQFACQGFQALDHYLKERIPCLQL